LSSSNIKTRGNDSVNYELYSSKQVDLVIQKDEINAGESDILDDDSELDDNVNMFDI
jgi:hypothetical protein